MVIGYHVYYGCWIDRILIYITGLVVGPIVGDWVEPLRYPIDLNPPVVDLFPVTTLTLPDSRFTRFGVSTYDLIVRLLLVDLPFMALTFMLVTVDSRLLLNVTLFICYLQPMLHCFIWIGPQFILPRYDYGLTVVYVADTFPRVYLLQLTLLIC